MVVVRRKTQLFLNNISPVYDTHAEVVRKKLKRGKFPSTPTGIIKMFSMCLELGSVTAFVIVGNQCTSPKLYYLNLANNCLEFTVQFLLFLFFSFGLSINDPGFWVNLDIILNLILSLATLVTSTVMLKICSGTDLDGLSESLSIAGTCCGICGCAALFLLYRYVEDPESRQDQSNQTPGPLNPRKSLFA